jgi:hypothetical protein
MKDKVEICNGFIEGLEKKRNRKYEAIRFGKYDNSPIVLYSEIVLGDGKKKNSELEKLAQEALAWKAREKNADAVAEFTYIKEDGLFKAYCFCYRISDK